MVTAFSVPADKLIFTAAEKLKQKLKQPEWAQYAKTGTHTERPPVQEDWWWTRAASLLRKVYTDGPVGVNRLRVWYGGSKQRGSSPNRVMKAGGKIIRLLLQDLEKIGYMKKVKEGRIITPEGQKFLDSIAFEVSKSGK